MPAPTLYPQAGWDFRTFYSGTFQATLAGGIDFLELIPGLLKSFFYVPSKFITCSVSPVLKRKYTREITEF
jgi:hypothetical protein